MTVSNTPKWFVTSRGVMGPLLAIVAVLFTAYGVEFSPETQTVLLEQVDALILAGTALVGSVVGIIGRVRAKAPVGVLPKVPK